MAPGKLPQNIQMLHTDYFELNLLNKQLVQEEPPDPPLFPLKQEIQLSREGIVPMLGGWRASLFSR